MITVHETLVLAFATLLGNLTTTVRDKDLKIESLQADVNQLVVKLKKHEV